MKKTSPIIIGIDSSTTCTGYAVLQKEKGKYKLIKYGKIIPPAIQSKTHPKGISYLKVCEAIYSELEKVVGNCGSDNVTIVFEQPNSFRNGDTTRKLCGLYGILRYMVSIRFGIEPLEANTKTVKSVVCGNGNADKKAMVDTINKMYGLKLKFSTSQNKEKSDDDISDAIGVATYHAGTLS